MDKQFYEQKKIRKHNRDINQIYLNCLNELIGRHNIFFCDIETHWREDIIDDRRIISWCFNLIIITDKYDFSVWVGKEYRKIDNIFFIIIRDGDDNVLLNEELEFNQQVVSHIRNTINKFGGCDDKG